MSSSHTDEFGRTDLEPPRKPKPRPSALTIVGVVLLVTGLACLGWVAYQYFGTNVTSQQTFKTEREELRTKWTAEKTSDPSGKKKLSELPGEAIALLRIPRFGSDYEIPILNGTDLAILSKGVGHYSSTAGPGEIGNFALAGHRVTHGQPFARLLELERGDQIIVETRETIYTYVLDESPKQLTVRDTDTWVIDPVPGKPDTKPTDALITLTTCQDLFRSPDRSIGFGRLESMKNK
ncbi:MAG TPA: class E sortase [Propionibacteriaceae bacterium]|nr:class E sortase [Propionibacteriaceae bacterium]